MRILDIMMIRRVFLVFLFDRKSHRRNNKNQNIVKGLKIHSMILAIKKVILDYYKINGC